MNHINMFLTLQALGRVYHTFHVMPVSYMYGCQNGTNMLTFSTAYFNLIKKIMQPTLNYLG
jgi:hypothetical protein